MKSKTIGNRYHYFTYDVEPSKLDGKYHVGEGTQWHWEHKGAFKTAKGARNWALKRNYGDDTYTD